MKFNKSELPDFAPGTEYPVLNHNSKGSVQIIFSVTGCYAFTLAIGEKKNHTSYFYCGFKK